MILSIDQSLTATGVCYISEDGRIETSIIKTSPKQKWFDRISTIVTALEDVFYLRNISLDNPSPVTHVVMEDYAYGGSMKGFVLGELGGCIKYKFGELGVEVKQLAIAHPKMYVSRHGRADKKMTMKCLQTRFNIHEKNNNIADAIGIGLCYKEFLRYHSSSEKEKRGFLAYDRAVFEKMEVYLCQK